MEEELVIRRATAGDAALLLELNREIQALHAAGMPGRYKPIVTDDAPFAALLAEADARTYVAEWRGEPVGYCHARLVRRPENPFSYPLCTILVDQLAVLEAHQGRGIGTALLAAADAFAADSGADGLILDVVAFNTAARHFYARRGFVPLQERLARPLPRSPSP